MPAGKFQKKEDLIDYKNSADVFNDILNESEINFYIGSFEEFVQNIFSKSFPAYNFDVWHIHTICKIIDKVLAKKTNRYLLAALPRGHLKSTIIGYASFIYRLLTEPGDGLYVSVTSDLCSYHLGKIKEAVANNEILSKVMIDLRPDSDTGISYRIGNRKVKV